ncbi:MAG: hypothetical protein ABSE81_02540 [Candidatus Omnitrophota bacterium]|jgi:hypothetical protein
MKKEEALKELANRNCPPKIIYLPYVRRLQAKLRELESKPEFQKDLSELKKIAGEDLNLNHLRKRKYMIAFFAMSRLCLKWGLQGFRGNKPVLKGLKVESKGKDAEINLSIPEWANSGDIRDYLPEIKKSLKGRKFKYGALKNIDYFEYKRKIRAEFKKLRKRGDKPSYAIDWLSRKYHRTIKTIKEIVYSKKYD